MCAFTWEGGRTLKIMGTKGQICADMEAEKIVTHSFLTGVREEVGLHVADAGHSGGDEAIVRDFVRQVASKQTDGGRSSAKNSVQSHLMSLAAERSRLEHSVVDLQSFRRELSRLT